MTTQEIINSAREGDRMTLLQIAEAIAANASAVDKRLISWADFSAKNRRLLDLVSRGEPCVIGNSAARRQRKVLQFLRSF